MGASTGQVRSQTCKETQNLDPEGIYLLASLSPCISNKGGSGHWGSGTLP